MRTRNGYARSMGVVLFLMAMFCGGRQTAAENLVPDKASETFNYWCTWSIQYYQGGNINEVHARKILTEETVFGPKGWANVVHPKTKGDLYLVLDDGWDLPMDEKQFEAYYGSLLVDSQRWPSCTGTPAERLGKLNQLAKSCGWKGVGIWICAQESKALVAKEKEAFLKNNPDAQPCGELDGYEVNYWTTRLQWTRQAGIRYWKVDWGRWQHNQAFRQWLTETARREAPDLVIEHAMPRRPYNEEFDYNNVGRLDEQWIAQAAQCVEYADVFRLYDQSDHLGVPIMLERIGRVLGEVGAKSQSRGLLNCEHEVYMAAVLGLNIGEMRHPFLEGPDVFFNNPRAAKRRLDESVRALRWQRLAPPFGVGRGKIQQSKGVLFDEYNYDDKSFWTGKGQIRQGAAAQLSRGVSLPEVTGEGLYPYMIAGRNPNGAVAVATFGRLIDNNKVYYTPRVEIGLHVGTNSGPVGVFGFYKQLTLRYDAPIQAGTVVLAQDLAGDAATDITREVTIQGAQITLSGELIEKIGLSARTADDLSDPGLVLVLR